MLQIWFVDRFRFHSNKFNCGNRFAMIFTLHMSPAIVLQLLRTLRICEINRSNCAFSTINYGLFFNSLLKMVKSSIVLIKGIYLLPKENSLLLRNTFCAWDNKIIGRTIFFVIYYNIMNLLISRAESRRICLINCVVNTIFKYFALLWCRRRVGFLVSEERSKGSKKTEQQQFIVILHYSL